MFDIKNFDAARRLLEKSQRILLTTHERTDGDDLGSVLALADHLRAEGKDITIAIVGGVPEQLTYLPGSDLVAEDIDRITFDLLVISGCSKIERCGNPKIINLDVPVLNIDHHPDNTNYGAVNVVDPEKSAVAELVFDFFNYCGWEISTAAATCMLTGIFTDTGSFMHSNTQNSTLNAASSLMSKGARVSTVAKHNYKGKGIAALKAWGKALENAHYDEQHKIILSVISQEELNELGNPPMEYFEGLVETLNKVPEAKFALFLKQDGDMVKGSLRSDPHKGTDVKEIAHLFGGGGHKWASGFSVLGQLVKNDKGKWQVVK
jgi:phosphoesterase RecJ-like protein